MFLDLDKFKQINDEYGHDIGDKVLLTIAERLKQNAGSDDTICRLGGDEFLYLLMEAKNEREITKTIKKLFKVLELPCDDIDQNSVHAHSTLAKSYLNLLVDEIVVSNKIATMKGSYSALADAAKIDKTKVGHLKQVPTSMSDWCAQRDSNS